MTWFGWVLIGMVGLSTALTILQIGKRRDPITPGLALAVTILNGLLVWGAVTVGTTQ